MIHRTTLASSLRSSLGLAFASLAAGACGAVSMDDSVQGAQVRVAHLSPDAPSVDFCLAPHGTAEFAGPILATSGGPTGLAYGSVTKYFAVAANQYDVRLVAPGAASCATALGGLADFTNLPDVPDGVADSAWADGLNSAAAWTETERTGRVRLLFVRKP